MYGRKLGRNSSPGLSRTATSQSESDEAPVPDSSLIRLNYNSTSRSTKTARGGENMTGPLGSP